MNILKEAKKLAEFIAQLSPEEAEAFFRKAAFELPEAGETRLEKGLFFDLRTYFIDMVNASYRRTKQALEDAAWREKQGKINAAEAEKRRREIQKSIDGQG